MVGGDGAGKSTCLQVLVGLLQPAQGTVLRPPKERIGYVPATAGLYADLTVQENLDFSASAYRLSGRDYSQRAQELLEQTGLGPRPAPAGRAALRRNAAQAGRRDGPAARARPPGS